MASPAYGGHRVTKEEPFEDDADFLKAAPLLSDPRAPRPSLGEHDLSPGAIRQRANRIFTPRADGTLKVSQVIFNEWRSKGKDRKLLEQIFRQCGYNPES